MDRLNDIKTEPARVDAFEQAHTSARRHTRTRDAMNARSVCDMDARSRAVAASVQLAGRSAHDASTSARSTSGATMSAALSPTAACEAAAAVRSKKKPYTTNARENVHRGIRFTAPTYVALYVTHASRHSTTTARCFPIPRHHSTVTARCFSFHVTIQGSPRAVFHPHVTIRGRWLAIFRPRPAIRGRLVPLAWISARFGVSPDCRIE
jgi:hypothetical protein